MTIKKISANIAPVCLPVTTELAAYNFSGRQLTVTGFGATETGEEKLFIPKKL